MITCWSCYFPESVCTGVYGVRLRYSLFYYLLLLLVMYHVHTQFKFYAFSIVIYHIVMYSVWLSQCFVLHILHVLHAM